jgi:hypothetical protein
MWRSKRRSKNLFEYILYSACLRENVDLFACSDDDMAIIDHNVACLQPIVSPSGSRVAQRRRK